MRAPAVRFCKLRLGHLLRLPLVLHLRAHVSEQPLRVARACVERRPRDSRAAPARRGPWRAGPLQRDPPRAEARKVLGWSLAPPYSHHEAD
jgi:hypothetical protein